jgi:hypothetical protein
MTLHHLNALAAAGSSITLYHGTDWASALDIQQNGLSLASAQAARGTGEFWATDDLQDADWFALSNNANGPPARLEFEMSAVVLIQLLAAIPAHAQFHQGIGLEFFPASFPTLNQHMRNKQVFHVP